MSLTSCLKSSVKGRKGSTFTGVHRSSGKQEAYAATVYDKKKAWTVYLGTFDSELEAARAHDIATFKCSGKKAKLNFPKNDYEKIWKLMENMSKEQVMAVIRRNGSRFSRTSDSSYRGIFRKPGEKRWAAHKQIEKETFYLGSFETAEEAAMAYDVESIKINEWNALTNFDINLYNVEAILAAEDLSFAEGRVSFVKKELLEMPQNYIKGKGNQFLDEVEDHLQALSTTGQSVGGGGGAQIIINDQLPDDDPAQESDEDRSRTDRILDLFYAVPAYHFPAEAGSRFQHSSSSCFKPYK